MANFHSLDAHSVSHRRFAFRRIAAVFVCLCAALPAGRAGAQEAKPSPTPLPEAELIAELERKADQIEPRVVIAEQGVTATRAAELGVDLYRLQSIAGTLRNLQRTYQTHANTLRELLAVRESRKELARQVDSFAGLPEPPPYTVAFVDSLRDAVDLKELERHADALRFSQTQAQLAEAETELEEVSKQRRELAEQSATVQDPLKAQQLDYELRAVHLRETLLKDTIALRKTQLTLAEETEALRREEAEFLRRKAELAVARAPFTRQEYEQRLGQFEAARKELELALKNAKEANQNDESLLNDARANLEQAATEEQAARARLELAKRKSLAETSAALVGIYQDRLQVIDAEVAIWRIRFSLVHPTAGEVPLGQMEQRLSGGLAHLDEVLESQRARMVLLRAQIAEQTRTVASPTAAREEREAAGAQLAALQKYDVELMDNIVRLTEMVRVARRLQADVHERAAVVTWGKRLGRMRDIAGRVWNYEVFYGEDNEGNVRYRVTVGEICIALLILSLGVAASRFVTGLVRRNAIERFRIEANRAAVIETVLHYTLLVFVGLLALSIIDVPLTIFAFAGGALAIGIGFGAQNFINNFLSGLFLLFEQPIRINDVVEVEGQQGRIMHIGWRCSKLRLFSGVEILVPNSTFIEQKVVNWTHSDNVVRFTVRVGAAYGSSTREVAKLMLRAVEENGKVLKNPEPVVVFEDFGDNALIFDVFFWLALSTATDSRVVRSDIRHRIDELFRKAGINIAFPQRDIHVDSSRPLEVRVVSRAAPGGEPDPEEQ